MSSDVLPTRTTTVVRPNSTELLHILKNHYASLNQIRRGVCLLNAGRHAAAEAAFRSAIRHGCTDLSLSSYLAASLIGQRKPKAAALEFAQTLEHARGLERPPDDGTRRIRQALSLWSAGDREEAIEVLRKAIRSSPDCAELHFQLGTMLTSWERYEEAELRFTQVLNIDRDHTEALVSLSLCCAVRHAPGEALPHLQRAQARRPHDARIGLLLARAAKAVGQQGFSVRTRAEMPDDDVVDDERGIEELSRVIESEPDFVDAFLMIPVAEVDERVFAVLLKTLERALERQPEHAELHFHCGRVLGRLGRPQDAIDQNERAVALNPGYTRALIELAELYRKTDRNADATTRLERAIAAGAEYADVYYLLGNLYRDQGQVGRARSAYRQALILNERYEAALQALEALPAH